MGTMSENAGPSEKIAPSRNSPCNRAPRAITMAWGTLGIAKVPDKPESQTTNPLSLDGRGLG